MLSNRVTLLSEPDQNEGARVSAFSARLVVRTEAEGLGRSETTVRRRGHRPTVPESGLTCRTGKVPVARPLPEHDRPIVLRRSWMDYVPTHKLSDIVTR